MSSSTDTNAREGRARTAASSEPVLARLRELVGAEFVLVDAERMEPYAQDAV